MTEEVEHGEIYKIDISDNTDIKKEHEELVGEDTAYLKVSGAVDNTVFGTLKKDNFYFKARVEKDSLIEKLESFQWK